jgi:hypothetical protein
MLARSAVVAAVAQDSAYWSLGSAAVTGVAGAALGAWIRRWFFALDIGACVLWFVVTLQRLFIPLPPPTQQWSAAEVTLPVAQLVLRIAAGVYTTTPYGPKSNANQVVWCIGLWGISVAVHALIRLWCVCFATYRVTQLRPCSDILMLRGHDRHHRDRQRASVWVPPIPKHD